MINFIINFYFLGIVILNSANSPSSESTDILPFKSWIISKAVDSPSPGFIPPLLVVKKGSKILKANEEKDIQDYPNGIQSRMIYIKKVN